MRKKILIFYISRYSGHFHAAMAIEEGLRELRRDIDIVKINALDYTNPVLGKIINKTYIEIIKKKPQFWGHIYDNPKVLKKTKKAREALHRFNMSKIKRLLDEVSPDVIYCTQAFPCGMVADYKRSCGKKVPLIGVLTDHAPHSYWLYDEVDHYVVPSSETAGVLEAKGIPAHRIKVYGIPVDPRFRVAHDKKKIMDKLDLTEDDPTVLVMGGSQGLGVMEDVVRSFMKDTMHSYQLLVVAGSNRKLYNRLGRLSRKGENGHIKILPFVENIDELMEASDLIVTKAGGMTTAEALVKNLPILVVKPIPGHERMNTDFLVGRGAAIEVSDHHGIYDETNRLFDSEGTLESMRRAVEKISKPDSAIDTAKLAFEGN